MTQIVSDMQTYTGKFYEDICMNGQVEGLKFHNRVTMLQRAVRTYIAKQRYAYVCVCVYIYIYIYEHEASRAYVNAHFVVHKMPTKKHDFTCM